MEDEVKKTESTVEVDQRDVLAKSMGAIECIKVEDKRLYLKRPPRNILGIAFAQLRSNETQAYETIARGSAIRDVSDMEMIDNDDYFFSIITDLRDFLGKIELKKSNSQTL